MEYSNYLKRKNHSIQQNFRSSVDNVTLGGGGGGPRKIKGTFWGPNTQKKKNFVCITQ
jgi:hypothetical protein